MKKAKKRRVTVAATLAKALRVFKGGKAWAKKDLAFNKHGETVNVSSPDAIKFCSIGALNRVDGPQELAATNLLKSVLEEEFSFYDIVDFNDAASTTFRDVKKAFSHAIKKAKAAKI